MKKYSDENVRNAKIYANRMTKRGLERKETEKGREKNALEREGMDFRLRRMCKIGLGTLF